MNLICNNLQKFVETVDKKEDCHCCQDGRKGLKLRHVTSNQYLHEIAHLILADFNSILEFEDIEVIIWSQAALVAVVKLLAA